jgi:hypothetical protein
MTPLSMGPQTSPIIPSTSPQDVQRFPHAPRTSPHTPPRVSHISPQSKSKLQSQHPNMLLISKQHTSPRLQHPQSAPPTSKLPGNTSTSEQQTKHWKAAYLCRKHLPYSRSDSSRRLLRSQRRSRKQRPRPVLCRAPVRLHKQSVTANKQGVRDYIPPTAKPVPQFLLFCARILWFWALPLLGSAEVCSF